MVALRDIEKGDEICITYVPNGDLDPGGTSARFRHFEPTRTWKWLNRNGTDFESAGNDNDAEELEGDELQPGEDSDGDNDDHDDDENDAAEGSDQTHRAELLLEYGFECRCQRCLYDKSHPATPYERTAGHSVSN